MEMVTLHRATLHRAFVSGTSTVFFFNLAVFKFPDQDSIFLFLHIIQLKPTYVYTYVQVYIIYSTELNTVQNSRYM